MRNSSPKMAGKDGRAIKESVTLKSYIASLEELLKVLEQTYLEQARRLENALAELAETNLRLLGEIEERKLAEEALGKNESKYRTLYTEMAELLVSIPSFLIGITPDRQIMRWNSAAERTFGISASKVRGAPLDDCDIRWDWRKISRAIASCGTNNAPERVDEVRFERKDGKKGFLDVTVSPVEGNVSGSLGFLLIGDDVTERKVLEGQLAQAQKLESIGQLAAGIAHEINTPAQYVWDNIRFLNESFGSLEHIRKFHDSLVDTVGSGQPVDVLVQEIKTASDEADLEYVRDEIPKAIEQSLEGIAQISRIVRAMKDFSHPGTGVKTHFDLNRAIESTITVTRNEWKHIAEAVTDLDPGLPLVPCLPGEINQVFLNLIINATHAIKEATERDGQDRKGVISISTRARGNFAEILIADTGIGIPEENRSKIFDPFFTTKDVGKGTGQGLAICHSVIVRKHGGSVSVESEPGKGTSFLVRLPIHDEVERR